MHFAPLGTAAIDQWVTSQGLQLWAGRAIVFTVVLVIGGLVGWLISYFVTQTGLSGTDRVLGLGFGLCRGALLIGVLIIAGQYLKFDQDQWWLDSRLLPYANRVADGIRVFAPRAIDLIRDEDEIDAEAPGEKPAGSA
jgi:membrane protein required for colicin V production